MKPEEIAAHNYLTNHYGNDIIFEPDGNIPPDFLVLGKFAVEVRRLNQQFINNDNTEGLEIVSSSIFKALDDVLRSFKTLYDGKTFWVGINYRRPLVKSLYKTKIDIKSALKEFLESGTQLPVTIKVNKSIELTIYEAAKPTVGVTFGLHGGMDHDAGGWVLPMYIDNVQHCINQKSSTLKKHVHSYREWWLVLVDYIEGGLDSYATEALHKQIDNLGIFNKVILISRDGNSLLTTIVK